MSNSDTRDPGSRKIERNPGAANGRNPSPRYLANSARAAQSIAKTLLDNAERERRNHYDAGYKAGYEAGLKEQQAVGHRAGK